MKLWDAVYLGWVFVLLTLVVPMPWLIGPGSILATLLPGTQHYMGFEGIEGVWILGTLPVLLVCIREQE